MESRVQTNIFRLLDQNITSYKVDQDPLAHPKIHFGVNAYYLQMRKELYYLGRINVKARREKLYKVFTDDFLREEKELREVDLAYKPTY